MHTKVSPVLLVLGSIVAACSSTQNRAGGPEALGEQGWVGDDSDVYRAGVGPARPLPRMQGDSASPNPTSRKGAQGRAMAARVFRNTYYDFPREGSGDKKASLFDAKCALISKVTQEFHDQVCVQGSGRLSTGETVSYARRDCPCAARCPRTGTQICFEKLDPKVFATGRGAAGSPVEPLRSVAVDSDVIPLGEVLFISEFSGLTLPDGRTLDGCFRADDRGSKVVGEHIDVFAGDPETTKKLNQLIPSNQGVLVDVGANRCAYLRRPQEKAPQR